MGFTTRLIGAQSLPSFTSPGELRYNMPSEISTPVETAADGIDPPLTKDEFEIAFSFRKQARETERACANMTVDYNATIDPYRATTLQPA
ncbi:uncharacterized protein N7484_010810 [Penicillium longicatenatum]|uniref:uncharacterized protein n=1 Tax=Penicillium longicatenatum TaxID=1561947 RepID=UPI002547943C|nr:uncharacterized protein N7484_010810 [Penicillium longicatenatum]KAJ5630710.1 hypothetical protein N7484_010810 [Penicillium longicatenatum]